MLIFISELIGTMFLIVLGCSVVANVILDKSGMKGGGFVQITFGWGLAVLIPVFIFGSSSGAHFNPAITLAFAIDKTVPWSNVWLYLSGQFIGAFLGAFVVWLLFKKHLDTTSQSNHKLAVFATIPSIPNKFLNFLSEMVGTFILVFAIKGISNVHGLASGLDKFLVFAIIVAIGMSLGGLTGYAINPARDLAPRLIHFIMPISDKGKSNWSYAWIPIVAPITGAILAVLCFNAIPFKQ